MKNWYQTAIIDFLIISSVFHTGFQYFPQHNVVILTTLYKDVLYCLCLWLNCSSFCSVSMYGLSYNEGAGWVTASFSREVQRSACKQGITTYYSS